MLHLRIKDTQRRTGEEKKTTPCVSQWTSPPSPVLQYAAIRRRRPRLWGWFADKPRVTPTADIPINTGWRKKNPPQRKVCAFCVIFVLVVIILFIVLHNPVICMRDTNLKKEKKNAEWMCLFVHFGVLARTSAQPLPSHTTLFRPGLLPSHAAALILYLCAQPVVATVDPLICPPTWTAQEGNGGRWWGGRKTCQVCNTKTVLTSYLPRRDLNGFVLQTERRWKHMLLTEVVWSVSNCLTGFFFLSFFFAERTVNFTCSRLKKWSAYIEWAQLVACLLFVWRKLKFWVQIRGKTEKLLSYRHIILQLQVFEPELENLCSRLHICLLF